MFTTNVKYLRPVEEPEEHEEAEEEEQVEDAEVEPEQPSPPRKRRPDVVEVQPPVEVIAESQPTEQDGWGQPPPFTPGSSAPSEQAAPSPATIPAEEPGAAASAEPAAAHPETPAESCVTPQATVPAPSPVMTPAVPSPSTVMQPQTQSLQLTPADLAKPVPGDMTLQHQESQLSGV